MADLDKVLAHVNTDFSKVVMTRIFVTDFRYYETVNEIYASYFDAARRPSRTTVGVTGLAGYGDVEIDLIVYCGD